jgi:hypothetical protein
MFGFPEAWAWRLMPIIGSVDITLGILALIAPTRAGLLYMGCWGFFTALLRPLAGEGGWEVLERSYNFGVPLMMLWGHGWGTPVRSWFRVIIAIPRFTVARAHTAQWVLRVMMASMLMGHGALGLVIGKPNLLRLYDAAGFGGFGLSLPSVSAANCPGTDQPPLAERARQTGASRGGTPLIIASSLAPVMEEAPHAG